MPRFAYTAFDARGAEMTGLLDAADGKQVAIILRGQGLFPTEVAQATTASAKPAKTAPKPAPTVAKAVGPGLQMVLHLPFIRVVGAKELAVFTRQLATLLRAGMPLLRGLEVLALIAEGDELFADFEGGWGGHEKISVEMSQGGS